MLTEEYANILTGSIDRICRDQKEKILAAAELVGTSILSDGLIYVFGCGHSHILAEETFYRAGGLACVCPIFSEPLMLHESASLSSKLEKESGHAGDILRGYSFNAEDILICVSTSGINGVPVELAAAAKEKGIKVIGIASDAYLEQQPRNALGLHLQQVCDLCIDNCAPHGDACLRLDGLPVAMTPVTTVTGAFIINSILAEAVSFCLERGFEPPVYLSGNIPGGSEHNKAIIDRYKPRIRSL